MAFSSPTAAVLLHACLVLLAVPALLAAQSAPPSSQPAGRAFYLDSQRGDDGHTGRSLDAAWKTLARANAVELAPGDALRLARGSRFGGSLTIRASGRADRPVTVEPFGEGARPIIDAHGQLAGVKLTDAQHVRIAGLEITGDGGRPEAPADPRTRYGVLVHTTRGGTTSHVTLRELYIHDIFPAEPTDSDGRNPTTHMGTAIAIDGGTRRGTHMRVENCRIERTGYKAIDLNRLQHVQLVDNRMKHIGGPAIQPGRVDDLLVRGNVVDGSGSRVDPRMHGRGSGIWPWSCARVLIEGNTFMHARGKMDSCGMHIDFNCSDVVVQYNLSIDNEGGFVEILGNNRNCAYRYNISINDGARVKGKDGAAMDGRILWTSGFVGRGNPKRGPFNSYIYNNTIYVGDKNRAAFAIAATSEGLLIANNLFCLTGPIVDVSRQDGPALKGGREIPRALVTHNLYLTAPGYPKTLPIREAHPITGDPALQHPGGLDPQNYIPTNAALVKDRGIVIRPLEGDDVGLRLGLDVEHDFVGHPITGAPDIGAIEFQAP